MAFNIPKEYLGQPAKMANVKRDPYEGIDKAMGMGSSDAVIAQIARGARASLDKVLAITLIAPWREIEKGLRKGTPEDLVRAVRELIYPRIGDGDFFVVDEEGDKAFHGRKAVFDEVGILQALGSSDPKRIRGLQEKREVMSDLDEQQTQSFLRFLNCPDNALVIEINAGSDFDRTTVINEHVKSRGGRLVCQDLTPRAAQSARTQVPGVPFVILPHTPEFLVPPFQGLSGPKFVTAKNFLSSSAFGAIENILNLVQQIGAQKVVFTQSFGIPLDNTNMLPASCHPGEALYNKQVMSVALAVSALPISDEKIKRLLGQLCVMQMDITISQLLMEMAAAAVKIHGGTATRTHLTEHKTEISGDEAIMHLEKHLPRCKEAFQQNQLNTITMSPFGMVCSSESDVPEGALRLKSIQCHIEASRPPYEPLISHDPTQCVTPLSFRRVDLPATYYHIKEAEKKDGENGRIPSLSELKPYEQLVGNILKAGAYLGHQFVFNVVGRQAEHPFVGRFLGGGEQFFFEKFVEEPR